MKTSKERCLAARPVEKFTRGRRFFRKFEEATRGMVKRNAWPQFPVSIRDKTGWRLWVAVDNEVRDGVGALIIEEIRHEI